MNDLRDRLHRLVDDVAIGPPAVETMLAARRSRRWVPALAAATVVAAVAATLGIAHPGGGARSGPSTAPSSGLPIQGAGWQRLADPPLSARSGPLGAFVDGRVLVLGGSDATVSGGPYREPDLRDGAAWDPATGRWQSIARAPWAPATASATAVAGDRLLLARNGPGPWALYDAAHDSWRAVPEPPQHLPQPTLAVLGDRVYAVDTYVTESPAPVQVLDLSTMQWSALPSSYLGDIDSRTLVAAGSELVVMGDGPVRIPGGRGRYAARAEIWDGTRWTPYQSGRSAGLEWHWTGHRIISTYRVTRHDATHGHDFPAAAFDPATGRWTRLPWLPPAQKGLLEDSWPAAYGPRSLSEGFLYDDLTGRSVPVRAPSPWGSQLQVLTDDALVLVGGSRVLSGLGSRVFQLELTNDAWILPLS